MAGIDMLLKVAIEQAMKTLPPETLQQIGQIGQTVSSFKLQLDRIEANQQTIMRALNVDPQPEQKAISNGHPKP